MDNTTLHIAISDSPLSLDEAYKAVEHNSAGGIDIFVGTVRDQTKGKEVLRLNFEAYHSMALKEMRKIADRASEKYDCLRVAIIHREGEVNVGEIAVIIAASAPHRDAAFKACRFCIDQLKLTVPIWKKEIFKDGEVWVNAHP